MSTNVKLRLRFYIHLISLTSPAVFSSNKVTWWVVGGGQPITDPISGSPLDIS